MTFPKSFPFAHRETFRVHPVAIVDAQRVAVTAIDVVTEDFNETALVVVAQIVLVQHVFVAIINVCSIGVNRPVGIFELVELHHHIAAIKRPHATPPLPHAFVHIRSCVIEDAVLHRDELTFIGHETGTSGVLEQTRIHHNTVILERVILIEAK